MKWLLVSKQSAPLQVFHLMEGNAVKEKLLYNPSQQSARISCQGRQRLFFIEQRGFRNTHSVIKNEYGFDIGKFFFDRQHSKGGTFELEDIQFDYSLENSEGGELVVYRKGFLTPVLSCGLNHSVSNGSSVYSKETIKEYACLLLGLCWFLFQPPAIEIKPLIKENKLVAV
jgi:hypothetical protein